ncbi:MAG: hypothetical protein M1832_002333 [Thelocarpon impressellum]|nr:MAG: hypothetical protein M1832_002333 [Thelocarpon impressellum]
MVRLSLFASSALLALAMASPRERRQAKDDTSAFQSLLNAVSDSSLHAALHEGLDKFSHGVFMDDRTAVEAVHRDNAAAATSLINKAKRQLASNETTASVPSTTPTSASTIIQPSSETTASVIPTSTALTTSSEGSSAPSSTPTATVSSTESTPSSTTDSPTGSTPSTTPTRSSTRTFLSTSTLPNGSRSTVTAVTVVGGGGNDAAGATAGAGSATAGTPGLQSGAAVARYGGVGGVQVVIGGVVLGMMVL